MIFFHDKHWFQSQLQTVQEVDEEEDEDSENEPPIQRAPSPTPSQATITSAPASSAHKKTEYEFLLFNYLLRFVHREGRIGDFARAGLLFLMDVAMTAGEPTSHRLVDEDVPSTTASTDSDVTSSDPVSDAALALAEYVLDGDFSEVLGAGLGAVYSLLPSKLDVRPDLGATPGSSSGMTLGAAVFGTEEEKQRIEFERERSRALGLESSSSPDFKTRLDHFLKLLEFLQDVLRRNVAPDTQLAPSVLVGTAIVQSILDAVKTVFLENILYTSILECSDMDGSAVAVMSYIDIMIRTLNDSQLADVLVNFLMSEDDHEATHRPHPRMLALDGAASKAKKERDRERKIRRRKSSAMVLLEMEAPESRKQSDYFTSLGRFTLKDLIFSNLRSPYQPSATAALQLLQSLLTYHSAICLDKLLVAVRDPEATSFPQPARMPETVAPRAPSMLSDDEEFKYPGAEPESPPLEAPSVFKQPDVTFALHEREMDMYLALISRVGPSNDENSFSTGYDHYLNDAIMSIQCQSSFRRDVFTERPASGWSLHHRLDANDPLLALILKSLRAFFSQTPEHNIALTGVLAALALDPYRSLAGWLTSDPPRPESQLRDARPLAEVDDGDDRSVDFNIGSRVPALDSSDLLALSLNESTRPILYSILQGLVSQLDRYRSQVENFDKYLIERRQGLVFSENLNDALNLALELADDKFIPILPRAANSPAPSTSPSRPKPKHKGSSLVSFLTPKKKGTSSREAPTPSEPSTPPGRKEIAASPFGSHYQETGAIAVQPLVAPLPTTGPWSPTKNPAWSTDDDGDVFTASTQWGGEKPQRTPKEGHVVTKVTLSQLLDNVVVLEESTKELTATIHARRSLGIDAIRYL